MAEHEHVRITLHLESYNNQWYSVVVIDGEERHRSAFFRQAIQAMTDAVLTTSRFMEGSPLMRSTVGSEVLE